MQSMEWNIDASDLGLGHTDVRRLRRPRAGRRSVREPERAPQLEAVDQLVVVEHGGELITRSRSAVRVIEDANPPVYYIPRRDLRMDLLTPSGRTSFRESQGHAVHWSLRVGDILVEDAAWSYPMPRTAFAEIRDFLAFHADRVERYRVGEQTIAP